MDRQFFDSRIISTLIGHDAEARSLAKTFLLLSCAITSCMISHLLNNFLPVSKGLVVHISPVRSNDFAYFTESTSTIYFVFHPKKVCFPPFLVLHTTCSIMITRLSFLICLEEQKSLSSPLLLLDSLVVSAVEWTDVLEPLKKDIMSIIRLSCESSKSLCSFYTLPAELFLVQTITS